MSEFVVVRLISGETVVAKLTFENEEYIYVKDPISIKHVTTTKDGSIAEKSLALPFCALTLERDFSFKKSHVMFVKELDPSVIEYYSEITEEAEEEEFIKEHIKGYH